MIFFTVVIIGEQVVLRFAGRVGLLYASINSTKGKNRKSIISVIIIPFLNLLGCKLVLQTAPWRWQVEIISPFIQTHRLKTFSVLLWINSHQPCGKRKSVSLTITYTKRLKKTHIFHFINNCQNCFKSQGGCILYKSLFPKSIWCYHHPRNVFWM